MSRIPIAELIQQLWDSVASSTPYDRYPNSSAEERLIDERLEAYRANPEASAAWPEVKARILGRE